MPPKKVISSILLKNQRVLIVCVFFLINLVSSVRGIEHCLEHLYQKSQNASHMQFTRETVSQEYAVEGKFKSLHCCAKGYRSIEW